VLTGKGKGDISQLSSMFYTYIPHNFGMAHMSQFTINTIDKLKEKIALIENLSDIKIAHKIVESRSKKVFTNLVDDNYSKLKCDIKTLSSESNDYKMIETYL
jgi:poly [ADP-ribose] polymerase